MGRRQLVHPLCHLFQWRDEDNPIGGAAADINLGRRRPDANRITDFIIGIGGLEHRNPTPLKLGLGLVPVVVQGPVLIELLKDLGPLRVIQVEVRFVVDRGQHATRRLGDK